MNKIEKEEIVEQPKEITETKIIQKKKLSDMKILIIIVLIMTTRLGYIIIYEPERFFDNGPQTMEENAQKMIDYLEYKYDEEFVYSHYIDTGNLFTKGGTVIAAYPKGRETEENMCTVVEKKKYKKYNQKGYARDNYFAILIRDEYEAMVKEEVDKYFDEYKLFSRFFSNQYELPNRLGKNSTLQDYLDALNKREGPLIPRSYLIMPYNGKSEKYIKNIVIEIRDNLRKEEKEASFDIIILKEPYYSEMNKEGWWGYLNSKKVSENKEVRFTVYYDDEKIKEEE